MKSIMEEASSIMKAIEKGWQTAGKPKEFTVKIFEEPEKNFIGMTVKPAKVALIFSEAPVRAEAKPRRSGTPESEKAKTYPERREKQTRQPREQEPKRREEVRRPIKRVEETPQVEPAAEKVDRGPVWTDDMISSAQEWLTDILAMIDVKVPFTVTPERFHLKIQFAGPVYDEAKREKHLFASVSHLLLTMLKRQYKRPLKGYKIVLTGT